MLEQINNIFIEISDTHLSILLLLGLALFGGTVGGRIFKRLKIPQVVGHIFIGVMLGSTGLNVINLDTVVIMQPFNLFALGLIGFMIGSELKKETLLRFGKQFIYILIFEGVTAFLVVATLVTIAGSFYLPTFNQALALGLLLGAIASATAPAATTDVLWEYKTRGPLTTMILGIVALDDGLALMLFAIASSVAGSLLGSGNGDSSVFFTPIYEIGGSFIVGTLSAFILKIIIERCEEEDNILALSVGTILLVLGLAVALKIDTLLTAMVLGMLISNTVPQKSKEIFRLVGKFTPPIYVLFFVLFGAKLNISNTTPFIAFIAAIYILGRTAGKMFGANLGARLSKAPKTVQKYLPACLFSQAGVAIGLSIVAGYRFHDLIGNSIVIIITTTTFVVQIIGPVCVKWAVTQAGEVGLNITEEDLVRSSTAKDIVSSKTPKILESMPLPKIISTFSESDSFYFPVVNKENKLRGIITVENIKNTLLLPELSLLLVAHDIMDPAAVVTHPDASVQEVQDMLKEYDVDHLPVIASDDTVLGLISSRDIKRLIAKKVLELQDKVDSLG